MGKLPDQQVANGTITSWGWLEHVLGGGYRRLWTLTGRDSKTLLQAETLQEFGSICGTHVDYLWDIQKSTPQARAGTADGEARAPPGPLFVPGPGFASFPYSRPHLAGE